MTLKDIINPWGALKKARRDAEYNKDVSLVFSEEVERIAEARDIDAKAHALKVKNLRAEIRRLEEVLASGHYRNPETGRLGRKGEMFPTSGETGGKS
jgi:gluconate kinase